MERDERANLYVLEAIVISMILLGAAYAVSTLSASSLDDVRPRAELARVVDDALTVLAGLDDGNGTSLLDLYVLQALHCAEDAVPSPIDCEGRRSKNLSIKLDHYFPLGTGYAIGVGNGAASREIYASPLPEGEATSSSRIFVPEWNASFVFTEFSCYPAAHDINATIIPIDRARVTWSRWGNVTIGDAEHEGQRAHTKDWWNVTIPGGTRPSEANVGANVTGNASFPGITRYRACDHGGLTAQLRDALKATTFAADAASVPVGGSVRFTADLSPLLAVGGAAVGTVKVTVYEPLPTHSNGPDSWIRSGDVVTLSSGAGTWRPPPDALYGTHPALLRISVTVGSDTFELRRATLVDVALPTGEVPIHAPYRVSLRAWLADWA